MAFALDNLLSSATPGVRRPIFELTMGTGPADDWADRVTAARVRCGLAPAADEAVIWLHPEGQRPAVGDALSLHLGYAGETGGGLASALGALGGGSGGGPPLVFTGTVTAIEPALASLQVRALNGGAKLQALRVWEMVESQTAGDIVSDLASRAGVTTGAVEGGVSLPAYVLDGRRHAYQHIAVLAQLCGFDAYLTPEDELIFAPFTKTTADHTVVYADDVLELCLEDGAPTVKQVAVIGESPASSQGQETWHWLASDWSSYVGKAGSGDPVLLLQARAARTQEAAQAWADSLLDRATRGARRGTLDLLGRAEIKVGDAVAMTGAPTEALNGLYQVVAVRHRLDRAAGFLTTLDLIGAGGGPGSLLGGLL